MMRMQVLQVPKKYIFFIVNTVLGSKITEIKGWLSLLEYLRHLRIMMMYKVT